MKKLLHTIRYLSGDQGFIFMYITFLTAFLLLSTFTSIALFNSNKMQTKLQLQQIELETLHQMAYQEFNEKHIDHSEFFYEYPNGYVIVTLETVMDSKSQVIFNAYTHEGTQKTRSYWIEQKNTN